MRVSPRPCDCRPTTQTTIRPTASANTASETPMSNAMAYQRFCAAIGRWRLPAVMAFFALALASLAPAAADNDHHHHHGLRFMIQNLYAGSFFQEFLAAKTPSEII